MLYLQFCSKIINFVFIISYQVLPLQDHHRPEAGHIHALPARAGEVPRGCPSRHSASTMCPRGKDHGDLRLLALSVFYLQAGCSWSVFKAMSLSAMRCPMLRLRWFSAGIIVTDLFGMCGWRLIAPLCQSHLCYSWENVLAGYLVLLASLTTL